ncbi:hypothetical protein ADIS_1895 [Lunatimonas lonarensis]|uniref:Uncharacterized protein n=1 Tax=Lunatimonas lonarensis TaxID=1232681 RepID=R7ZU48_9BACT|nr:hypothetical protein [Lunatimonas lonarensis]EON77676.1 hypothetical protein ADIS_1895 [Lunatimonas lonarensis]
MNEVHELFDFFKNHLPVRAIAEELVVFKPETYLSEMANHNFQTAVVAIPAGLMKFDVGDDRLVEIPVDAVFSLQAPLLQVFPHIAAKRRVFLRSGGRVTHIATRSDLDKIPVRLALFGFVSVLETVLKEMVRSLVPEWEKSLSRERLAAARKLYRMKRSRSEEIDVVHCLHLADLGSVFSKEKRYKLFGDQLSRKVFDDRMRDVGKLRDALAHSQDVLPFDWEEIPALLAFILLVMDTDFRSPCLK